MRNPALAIASAGLSLDSASTYGEGLAVAWRSKSFRSEAEVDSAPSARVGINAHEHDLAVGVIGANTVATAVPVRGTDIAIAMGPHDRVNAVMGDDRARHPPVISPVVLITVEVMPLGPAAVFATVAITVVAVAIMMMIMP